MCCKLVGKVVQFSLLGFLAIVLVGPVLGILGTLLPFALIGALVWGGYRGLRRLVAPRRPERERPPLPVREVRVEPVALPVVKERRGPSRFRQAGRVMLEMVCGALVGGLVCGAVSWQQPWFSETLAAGLLAGAAVGYIVGGSRPEPARSAC
jgi:hypothetical protein